MKIENTLKKLLFILILIFLILLLVPKSAIGIAEDNLRETNVYGYREAVVERVEKVEKLVSREYWDWWTWIDTTSVSSSATLTNISVQKPNIEVHKSVITTTGSNNLVYAGEEITYEISITNRGTAPAEQIEVIDRVPQNTTFMAINEGSQIQEPEQLVDQNNNTIAIRWIVTVEPQETATVSFTVKVNENIEGTITNTVVANGEESNETHTAIIQNEKSSIITRNGNEVEIAKVGDQVTYTITALNTGDIAGEITIQDKVPEGTTLISAEGATISEDNRTITWENVNVPALQDGGRVSVQFTVEINDINKEIKNSATVGGKGTEENKVQTADIQISKNVEDIIRNGESIGKDAKVEIGDIIKYNITVTNTGSVELTNIVINEELEGIEINGSLNIDSLQAGEQHVVTGTYTVTFENDIKEKPQKIIYNKVTVTANIPKDPDNLDVTETVKAEDDETTQVAEIKRASVVKSANKTENVKVGETIRYTIKVQNIGNVTLEDVQVIDEITTSAGKLNLKLYRDVDCTTEITEIPELRIGETLTLYARYTVTQEDIDTQTSISNIAIASIPSEEPTSSEPVEVISEEKNPGVDIDKKATAIKKSGEIGFTQNIDRVRLGDVIEYTVTVTNTGNTTLNNVTVTDSLTVTVDGEEKEVDEETGVSTIAIIDSLLPYSNPVIIKAYYTVTEADTANLDSIYNCATVRGSEDTEDIAEDESVPVNNDTFRQVNIIWDDNQNQDGKRPNEITINLYADGEYVKSETISGTTYTFEKLPTYNEDGNEIVYTVTENTVNEYTTSYSDDTLTITNTHIPETTSVTVNKVWDDNNDQDRIRTNSVSISVMNGNTPVETQNLSNGNNWTYTFTNLPKYENGSIIQYTVMENDVPDGYTVNVTGDLTAGYTVTNTHTPEKIDVSVTKVWEDKNNYYGARVPIEVTLHADGVQGETVTITTDDNWRHVFRDLPKYKDGVEIVYTVTEKAVEGYQTTITGNVATGFIITNKYNNVAVNRKTLTSAEESETSEQTNVDVVFILDISGSMEESMGNGDLTTRAEAMVNVTNKAITEIMKNNNNNRVGIVMYSSDVTTTLPLNSYTPITTTDDIGQYLQITSGDHYYNISTNVVEAGQVSKDVVGGTYTQLGIATGADMLANATDTSNRTPVMILLTDGGPTFSTTDYSNVTGTYNFGSGSISTADTGYLLILTANYYKEKADRNYIGTEALMYTIGLGMSGDYAETVFNPTEENVNKCLNSADTEANGLYNYLMGIESTVVTDNAGSVEVPNPYDNYSYADGSYVSDMSSSELEEILSDITENITSYYEITTDHTSNINLDVSRVELENIDTNKKITITLDGVSQEYTLDKLILSLTVIQEDEKYYIDLKASMFASSNVVDISYYDTTST